MRFFTLTHIPLKDVFAVVNVDKKSVVGKTLYKVAFATRDEVNRYGPPLPDPPSFEAEEFKEFLLTKRKN